LRRARVVSAPASPIRCASRQPRRPAPNSHVHVFGRFATPLAALATPSLRRYATRSVKQRRLSPASACDARRALRRVVALGPRIHALHNGAPDKPPSAKHYTRVQSRRCTMPSPARSRRQHPWWQPRPRCAGAGSRSARRATRNRPRARPDRAQPACALPHPRRTSGWRR